MEPSQHRAAWRDQWFLLAVALTLGGFVAAEVAGASLPTGGELRASLVGVLRLLTLLFALLGGAAVLERTSRSHTARVSRWQSEAQSWRLRTEAARAEWEERAHEARSSLSTIELAVYAAARHQSETSSWQSVADLIRSEVASLHRLLDGGDDAPEIVDFRVAEAIRSPLEAARLRGLDVAARVPPDLWARGEPAALAEMVRNLLDNAHRHAGPGPVAVACREEATAVILRVEDSGPGVDARIVPHLFERGVKSGPTGSGLGLYIARRLAANHGATLRLASGSRGAAFEIALPAATGPAPALEVLAGAA